MRCLWIARTMPFPQTSGDRIYTGKLMQALAATGVAITYVGLAGRADPSPIENVTWHVVPGEPRGRVVSLFSKRPLAGAQHATRSYRDAVKELLTTRQWDAVVVDHYGMGWVLDEMRRLRSEPGVLVFVGHDHEESVTRAQWRDAGRLTPKGLYFMQNHYKTRWIERSTARASQVITAITDADAECFRRIAPAAHVVTLTPGYDGARLEQRQVTADTPRAAVMFGSYRWSAKQANLKLFLEHAHQGLHADRIELRVIGDMDEAHRQALSTQYPTVQFTGFVADPTSLLDARLAVIAEPIGGGFKLKLLDYIFGGLPIVSLEACAAGLPDAVRQHVLIVPGLDGVTAAVRSVIDDVATLDRMQRGAFAAAEQAFNWADRGRALQAATEAARARPTRRPDVA